MLLILTFGMSAVILSILCCYLINNHEEWYWNHAILLAAPTAIIIGIFLGITLVMGVRQLVPDAQLKELSNSRERIIAELKSTDPIIQEYGIEEATAYNEQVTAKQEILNNMWLNIFINQDWANAELIEVIEQ